jgi:hypothetical protein
MAFVVARPRGRFEIREAVHTPDGPRSRTLANFAVLTDDFLARAAARASRHFDRRSVLASARRLGAPVDVRRSRRPPPRPDAGAPVRSAATAAPSGPPDPRYRHFATRSRRMARALGTTPMAKRADPGRALMDLLGFADEIGRSMPPRSFEPLTFPPLARLADRGASARSAPARTRRSTSASRP